MFGATIATALLVSDLIALLLTRRPLKLAAPTQLSIARHDLYLSHHALGLRPDEIDRKQPLRELGAQHLHPVCKKKPRWNCRAAMPRCKYSRVLSSCCRPRIV